MKLNTEDLIEYFEYLDDLRSSGMANMFGASKFLERDFDLDEDDARMVAVYWMDTFDTHKARVDRASQALSKEVK